MLFKLPAQPAIRALYMSHPIVSKVAKTMKRYIQTNYTLNHLAAHRPEWAGPDTTSDIDWPAYDQNGMPAYVALRDVVLI